MKVCYLGDARSVHLRRWVDEFQQRVEVVVVSTAPVAGLERVLPQRGSLPGTRLVQSVLAFKRMLRAEAPDLVHAHYANEAGWIAAASGFRPWILSVWGSDVYVAPRTSRLARVLNPRAVRRADAVICDSEDQRKTLMDWGADPEWTETIGWGVRLADFNSTVDGSVWRQRLQVPGDAFVVLSPRQWLANSNIVQIVEAHARLPSNVWLVLKRLPEFEGSYASQVEAAVAASAARGRIRLVGEVEEDDLPHLYAMADVVVSICSSDGTPMSVLEAMALERPVVALDVPSLREWLDDDDGVLLDSTEAGELRDALADLLADPLRRAAAGRRNRAVIERSADRAVEMDRAMKLYARVLARD